MTTRREIIDYLARCPGGELTALLAEVVARRPESGRLEEGWEARLAFAVVDRELEDDGAWGPWGISLVAEANPAKYGAASTSIGEPFLQMGGCDACGVDLVSSAKQVNCPICRAPLVLT
jgi:hypothetical protein